MITVTFACAKVTQIKLKQLKEIYTKRHVTFRSMAMTKRIVLSDEPTRVTLDTRARMIETSRSR